MSNLVCSKCRLPASGAFCSRCGGATRPVGNPNERPTSYARVSSANTQFVQNSQAGSGFGSNSAAGNFQAAMWCHLAPLLIGVMAAITSLFGIGIFLGLLAWLPPVIINANFKNDSFVRRHAYESINFQLFWLIFGVMLGIAYALIGLLTLGVGLVVLGAIFLILVLPISIFAIVSMIRGSIAGSSGKDFRYPLVLFRIIN